MDAKITPQGVIIASEFTLSWLRSQVPDYFPSPWMIPDGEDVADNSEEFVLVPVSHAYQTIDEKLFTPDARCEAGYEIGRACEPVEDYWEALERLTGMTLPRFRHPSVPKHLGSLPCQNSWIRVPASEIERQLEEVSSSEPLGAETAQFLSVVERDERFRPYHKGHSRKLFRFECVKSSKALALEIRKGTPNIYVVLDEVAEAPEIEIVRAVGAIPSGRNSNLNTIDQFKNRRLAVIRPTDEEQLRRVLDRIAE